VFVRSSVVLAFTYKTHHQIHIRRYKYMGIWPSDDTQAEREGERETHQNPNYPWLVYLVERERERERERMTTYPLEHFGHLISISPESTDIETKIDKETEREGGKREH
jgi:hypothetical protein